MKISLKVAVTMAFVIALCAFGPAGCGGAQNVQQTSITFNTDFDSAVKVGNAYGGLTFCTVPAAPVICADPTLVIKINDAEHKTLIALNAFRAAAYDPANVGAGGTTAAKLQADAAAALLALLQLTNPVAPKVNLPTTDTAALTKQVKA